MAHADSAEFVATVSTALATGRQLLAKSGIPTEDLILESRLLLQHAAGMTAEEVIGNPDRFIGGPTAHAHLQLIERRCKREPLAYITGEAEFYGRKFRVAHGVLIPRPESEMLVSIASDFATRHVMASPRICDLGTGSGVLAVSLALELERAAITACDISDDALNIAKCNSARYDVAHRIDLHNADMTCSTLGEALGKFDIIVANPPYIPTGRLENQLEPEVSKWEPRLALDGGRDGMEVLGPLIERIPHLMREFGPSLALIEIDSESAGTCLARATHAVPDAKVELIPDYAGSHRILAIERQSCKSL